MEKNIEYQYLELLKDIKVNGTLKESARSNMPNTLSLFGRQIRHDLQNGFPLLTTKKINFKNIVVELLWFLRGDTNIKFLIDNGCNIWNEDAYNYYLKLCKRDSLNAMDFDKFEGLVKYPHSKKTSDYLSSIGMLPTNYTLGDCGKQYGWLWRNFGEEFIDNDEGPGYIKDFKGVDQIKELIDGLKKNPLSRRHIITAWNPATLDDMALNACHAFVQFNCRPLNAKAFHDYKWRYNTENTPRYYLDCQMYQRSADSFLGVPYNIASYALLTHIIAKICNMIPGELIHTFGDVHIYENHMDQVEEQLKRTPTTLPGLKIREELNNIKDFEIINPFFYYEDFILEGYKPNKFIKAKLSTGLK